MSTATAAGAAAEAPKKGGKKKLLIIVGALVGVLAVAGGGAAFMLKKNAAAEAAAASGADDEQAESPAPKRKVAAKDPKAVPIFAPLEPFTVNLADREAERYAQVTVALELDDSSTEALIKTYLPVIRNNILMVLSHKTAAELLEREGKAKLAREIQRETSRALGFEVDDEDEESAADTDSDDGKAKAKAKAKKKKKRPAPPLPVTAVHFANFIIQ